MHALQSFMSLKYFFCVFKLIKGASVLSTSVIVLLFIEAARADKNESYKATWKFYYTNRQL